jgi:hypothetical protein
VEHLLDAIMVADLDRIDSSVLSKIRRTCPVKHGRHGRYGTNIQNQHL